MLDNFRRIDIRWEKATDNIYKSVNVMSSDELGRKLVVQVLDGGLPAKTDKLELELYWEAQNKKNYGLDYFELIDKENTIFEMYFTTGLLSNIGRLKSNLVLRDSKGVVTSNTFYIEVFEGIDSNAVESSNSFSKLSKIINEIEYISIEEEKRVQAEAERIRNEDLRAESEVGRRTSEETRKATEEERKISENKRIDGESLREQNEANRIATESQRESSENDRRESELNRVSSEKTRAINEASRESSETLRQSAEETRELQEVSREEKETIRSSNEDAREIRESERVNAENIRSESEKDRESQEGLRKTNEIERVDSENSRNAEEVKRVNSEKDRVNEEEERILKENQRATSESSRNSAEEQRGFAESTRKNNEDTRITNMEIVQGWLNNPEQFDGRDIEYDWRGTELGVRKEGERNYTYVDLKGEAGEIENLTPQHIENALGFVPKDYVAGDNISITNDTISVTGQLGLTEEEVKHVKVYSATSADMIEGYEANDFVLSHYGYLKSYVEEVITIGGTAIINLNTGNTFVDTPTANRTYSITNAKSGVAHSFTLQINMGTVRTLTFPDSVKWQGGEIPDMSTADKTYVLTFMSVDGGTTWLGMFGGVF